MTDISITAANVLAGADAEVEQGKFGATVVAGKTLYIDPTTKKVGLSDSNGATATKAVRGVALNGGADGQPGAWIRRGTLTGLTGLTAGDTYYLSATPGGICPKADLATGMKVIEIGYAPSTTSLFVDINDTGVTL